PPRCAPVSHDKNTAASLVAPHARSTLLAQLPRSSYACPARRAVMPVIVSGGDTGRARADLALADLEDLLGKCRPGILGRGADDGWHDDVGDVRQPLDHRRPSPLCVLNLASELGVGACELDQSRLECSDHARILPFGNVDVDGSGAPPNLGPLPASDRVFDTLVSRGAVAEVEGVLIGARADEQPMVV